MTDYRHWFSGRKEILYEFDRLRLHTQLIGICHAARQHQSVKIIRTRLAQAFRYIVSQRLIPKIDGSGRVAAVEILRSNPRTREYIEKGEQEGKTLLDAIRDGEIDGMQDFDSVIRDLIEKGVVSMEDGLSFATNQNNLLLQLKGLSSTEDYASHGKGKSMPAPMAPAPPPEKNPDSVLSMIE